MLPAHGSHWSTQSLKRQQPAASPSFYSALSWKYYNSQPTSHINTRPYLSLFLYTISTFSQRCRQIIIMDQTKYTNSVRMGDGNSHSGNVVGSFNIINNMADEAAEIMRWLSPMEPHNRHQGVRSNRLDGVGNWLLETNEFREWRSGEGGADKAVLFCHGNPGVGKTYLKYVLEFGIGGEHF
ncbi:hypothetical protein L873DRAFT_291654 [Choiromyces venosus 120613-1]|uniref:Nephrocystin 3-like N-terminal domain-containing protein n=1 Tax=Choiromyces venosus 120613-1 TaxID=1336337 RepID=A0A3N4J384_9PEZI|nr:hypothetical protein L873DRAFT_291654 [Choiromyces venosus 120613-1]